MIVAFDFSQFHSNSREVSYLPRQNTYPNLKSTCHMKLKFFLWTKLLEYLLLVKYLLYVAATLTQENAFYQRFHFKTQNKDHKFS